MSTPPDASAAPPPTRIQCKQAELCRAINSKYHTDRYCHPDDSDWSTSLPSPFPHPFYTGDYEDGVPPKTLGEIDMMALSGILREKPEWWRKCQNDDIITKWAEEAKEQGINTKQWNYILQEIQYLASIRDTLTGIQSGTVDGTYQSDILIADEIRQVLLQHLTKWESVPEKSKDWHPGSNHHVLDLVHPSLYCYVEGKTCVTEEPIPLDKAVDSMGTGEVKPLFADKKASYSFSKKFQWLPAEFAVDTTGAVTIKSYINNMHPVTDAPMYSVIEKVFACFIPMFEKVLTDLRSTKPNRVIAGDWYEKPAADSSSEAVEAEAESEELDEDDDDYYENRPIYMPQPDTFKAPTPPSIHQIVTLKGKTLQVIVKFANIELTPESPSFSESNWHVEGMENEHIVSTGIYYFATENITESRLQFRAAVCEPEYEQDDDRGTTFVYGFGREDPLNQEWGSMITKQNRCIAFPNILQHRVPPFELEDKSKPGFRKMLVFFLVDPSQRILSTANVPPQQSHWYMPTLGTLTTFTHDIPKDLHGIIFAYIDRMTLEEAKQYREELMKERKYFVEQNSQKVYEREFYMCEH